MSEGSGGTLGPWVFGAVVVVAATYLIASAEPPAAQPLLDPAATPRPVVARGNLAEDERATIELFESASDSVVFVSRLRLVRDVLGRPRQAAVVGTGTGFVWDADGVVVTNLHVIADGIGGSNIRFDEAVVTLADGRDYPARRIGFAENKDIAVLRIDAPDEHLKPIRIGTSSGLRVGQKVFAIGNPFGLDRTLTTGVISGLDRVFDAAITGRPIQGAIQTDAAINPGNSGGPLLDSAGLLIGMNTAIQNSTGASVGVGYAIPADTLNRIVPTIIRDGVYRRVGLGVVLRDARAAFVSPEDGKPLTVAGAVVRRVSQGGGADLAGLQPEDLIVEIAGTRVRTGDDVFRELDERQDGETVEVVVLRQGRELRLDVSLTTI
ncbi:MAG: trypsin-like peptidase domain-containing protein [Planctomycetota bacterium]